ncbi:LysE family translocator [Mangrovitalea sediminis]|uniref:LysE family translocator n=1 Tax=Mangrovitalea sediminis TaxID=1982043 RepID=UPI000BE56094|nr:LysE family transporter [Mangrovitalea sediminis]
MLAIFAYAIGMMYTPGPINLIGLNSGINGQLRSSVGFFLGVGLAMLILLLGFGWIGTEWVQGDGLVLISAIGCLYIGYLAVKIFAASIHLNTNGDTTPKLGFRDGLLMQLMNPKGTIATLPIAAIQFPAAGIHGMSLVMWSAVIAVMAVGAPGSYCLMGHVVGRRIANPIIFRWFNGAMAILLLYVAAIIAYQHVYLPLILR